MMARWRTTRSGLIVVVTLAVAGVLLLMLLSTIWGLQRHYSNAASDLGPRIARLQGLAEHEPQLRRAQEAGEAYLENLVYPADSDTQTTGTAMQQQVRDVLGASGLDVTGSQILPASEDEDFIRIRVDVTAEGELEALEAALFSLEAQEPLVLIESLNIQPQRTRRRGPQPQEVVARFRLVSLRIVP